MTLAWSVSIEVDPPDDIDDWKYFLQKPFDPWLEERTQNSEHLLLLRTSSFDGLVTASEVHERALPILERLNGAFRLSRGFGYGTLRASGAVQIKGDAALARYYFLQPQDIAVRVKMSRPSIVVTDAAGNVIPPAPPSPSEVQVWTKVADGDDVIAELLIHFARCDNWFDLYKTYELLKKRCGGQKLLFGKPWAPEAQVRTMRETANFYRHATYPRPKNPMSFDEARAFLQSMVRSLLGEVQAGEL